MKSENEIEKSIQEKGLNAPRLTPALIDSVIVSKSYHVFDGSCLTVCCLTLLNGFTVTGESACASPENFNQEIGEEIAFKNAREKIWVLEGYLLKDRLVRNSPPINVEGIARVAHEINAAFCSAFGDDSQPEWDSAPDWQKQSAANGVAFHIGDENASPSASHDSWLAEKRADGWVYGEIKDPEAKTHPCCVEYEMLPVEQKAKDYLFKQVVHSLLSFSE